MMKLYGNRGILWVTLGIIVAMGCTLPKIPKPISNPVGENGEEAGPKVSKVQVQQAYGKLPLSFEANLGQTDETAKFISRGPRYSTVLTFSQTLSPGGQK